jgi:hypothetical protein
MNQIEDINWVTAALNFWTTTTPQESGKSRYVINWNVKVLTEARARIEAKNS